MIGTVFERVKTRLDARTQRTESSKSSLLNGATGHDAHSTDALAADGELETPNGPDSEPTTAHEEQQRMTLQTFETRKSFDDTKLTDTAPTTVTRANNSRTDIPQRTTSQGEVPTITVQAQGDLVLSDDDDDEDEIYVKDAFLVFRAMCKLSTKTLRVEDAVDIKGQGMRSKLLSLHIIHTVLFNHSTVFTSSFATIKNSASGEPTEFTQAVKQYLCLSLSRNGASSVPRVFEVAAEIFWLMTKYLRSQLKRELEVFFKEIYLAVLEKRAAPSWQKSYIVQHLFRKIARDGRSMVEIYLNYDCDRQALDNMFQRIVEYVSRVASAPSRLRQCSNRPIRIIWRKFRPAQRRTGGKREHSRPASQPRLWAQKEVAVRLSRNISRRSTP